MVFGIGEGKIELELDSHNVSPGGKLSGKLKLELNSPKKAKELRVELLGKQKRTTTNFRTKESETETVIVFRSKQILGGEQEYTSGEYEFELDAPPKLEQNEQVPQEGLAGAIVGAAKVLKSLNPITYSVVASLDIPMSMDINKKVRVSVL